MSFSFLYFLISNLYINNTHTCSASHIERGSLHGKNLYNKIHLTHLYLVGIFNRQQINLENGDGKPKHQLANPSLSGK